MAYAADSKSAARKGMRVRLPPPGPTTASGTTVRPWRAHHSTMTGPRRAIGYPTNRLLAVIDDPARAAAALAELKAAGFADRDLDTLRGEESADRMDGMGEVSGWLGRLRRAFDFALMDQLVDFASYERALRDGRAVVMVHVHGDAPKETAHQILKRHGGHFINYYGRFATEELDLWRGDEPDIPGYMRR